MANKCGIISDQRIYVEFDRRSFFRSSSPILANPRIIFSDDRKLSCCRGPALEGKDLYQLTTVAEPPKSNRYWIDGPKSKLPYMEANYSVVVGAHR